VVLRINISLHGVVNLRFPTPELVHENHLYPLIHKFLVSKTGNITFVEKFLIYSVVLLFFFLL
jgi:hypothetical protein